MNNFLQKNLDKLKFYEEKIDVVISSYPGVKNNSKLKIEVESFAELLKTNSLLIEFFLNKVSAESKLDPLVENQLNAFITRLLIWHKVFCKGKLEFDKEFPSLEKITKEIKELSLNIQKNQPEYLGCKNKFSLENLDCTDLKNKEFEQSNKVEVNYKNEITENQEIFLDSIASSDGSYMGFEKPDCDENEKRLNEKIPELASDLKLTKISDLISYLKLLVQIDSSYLKKEMPDYIEVIQKFEAFSKKDTMDSNSFFKQNKSLIERSQKCVLNNNALIQFKEGEKEQLGRLENQKKIRDSKVKKISKL